jgi:hypothetical protein
MQGRSVIQSVRAVCGARNYRALVYLVLAAFVFQGFLTQTHTHWSNPVQKVSVGGALSDAVKSASKQSPGDRDDGNCPICHAASIAGAMFASAAPMLRVPSLSSLVPYVDEHNVLVERFTAAWRSRAPPSV